MTLTTETLNLWRNNAEIAAGETAEDDPEHIAAKAILALTAELLANREAQPVLYASEETLAYAKEGEKSLVTWSEPMGDAVIPLYTAPPAPAVPDALANDIDSDDHPLLWSYSNGWNACRAAMLESIDKPAPQLDSVVTRHADQPVSSGYKWPPHLYRELVNSLRDTAVKFSGTEQLRERLNTALSQFIEPDHPHTRTVAPEGGNDHDTRR